MLTVKAPIELKCSAGIVPSYEGFVHRITGNYEMMSTTVTGEDLLHLVTEPPEVFLCRGQCLHDHKSDEHQSESGE